MDINTADIPILNLTDFNLMLLDDYDLTKSDRKYMPLGKGEDDIELPNTCVHTVIRKPSINDISLI